MQTELKSKAQPKSGRSKKELTPEVSQRLMSLRLKLAAWKAEREKYLIRYRVAKQFAEANKAEIEAQVAAATFGFGKPISINSFVFVLQQLQELGLEGVPYLDTRTFKEWLNAGRVVRKGETAKLISFTWIGEKDSDDSASNAEKITAKHYPKLTRVFHISQTDELPPGASAKEKDAVASLDAAEEGEA